MVLGIARDLGEKFGLEQTVQDACGDLVSGVRISEVVMSFSEGLRASVPISGKVVDDGDMPEVPDVLRDAGEVVR